LQLAPCHAREQAGSRVASLGAVDFRLRGNDKALCFGEF
jgi:hypothetical protein